MKYDLTIKDLDGFGFTIYEAKVYLALMEKKHLSVPEIARLSDVPRNRIYDSLQSLESKGLCQVIIGKPKLYSAIDPSRLVEIFSKLEHDRANSRIKKYEDKIREEKNRLVAKLEDAKSLVSKLSPVYMESRDNEHDIDYAEIIKEPSLIHNKICDIMARAKKEILAFTKPPYVIMERRDEQWEQCSNAVNRGVDIRNIYEIPDDKESIPNLISEIELCTARGEIVRIVEKLPIKLIIIDEEIVVYSLKDPLTLKTTAMCSIVKHEDLARILKEAFNLYWSKAKSMEVLDNFK